MARRKKAIECEFCQEEWFDNRELPNASLAVEVYPNNTHIAIVIQSMTDDGEMNGEESTEIPMNYCPVCGRELGW